MTGDMPQRFSRATRTLMQFIVGGSLAGLVLEVTNAAEDMPLVVAAVAAAAAFAVAYAQNWLEDHGMIVDRRR